MKLEISIDQYVAYQSGFISCQLFASVIYQVVYFVDGDPKSSPCLGESRKIMVWLILK